MLERIQKVLAARGLGSRRQIEQWIKEGRITVNNRTASLGDKIALTDRISFNGRPVKLRTEEKTQVWIYHKPAGELCTRRDPEGRPTIFDSLPKVKGRRLVNVGRLDFNTSGLLLLTTNGELANRLMHPKYELEREYAVRTLGKLSAFAIERLQKGVRLEDGLARFEQIKDAGGEGVNHWYHVVLKEGRNREVRRLIESQNIQISRLMRIRFGPISLPRGLRTGQFRLMTPGELKKLYSSVHFESL